MTHQPDDDKPRAATPAERPQPAPAPPPPPKPGPAAPATVQARALVLLFHDGRTYQPGELFELPSSLAALWLRQGAIETE